MITTKDIARLCGVSVTTVNRALNDKPDVNPETKRRIVQTAEQNGYRPDILARRLVQGHSKVIGVLASDLENPFFSRFVIHLQRSAKARGYTIHTSIIENHPGDEFQALVELVSLRVDGIAYIPINEGAEYEAAVRKLGVPVVTLINRLSAGFDFVGTNEAEIMAQLTTAALDRGYVNLLYVHPQGERDPRRNHYSLSQRRSGVVSVLERDPRGPPVGRAALPHPVGPLRPQDPQLARQNRAHLLQRPPSDHRHETAARLRPGTRHQLRPQRLRPPAPAGVLQTPDHHHRLPHRPDRRVRHRVPDRRRRIKRRTAAPGTDHPIPDRVCGYVVRGSLCAVVTKLVRNVKTRD